MKRLSLWLFFSLFALPLLASIPDPNSEKYKWMDSLVDKNFQSYEEKGITLKDIEGTQYASPYLVRLKVINNQVYDVYGKKGAAYAMLKYLTNAYGLPDLDIIYLHQDGIFTYLGTGAPILCSSKVKSLGQGIYFVDWYTVISYPGSENENWDTPMTQPWWDEMVAIINRTVESTQWEEKKDQLIWRGRLTDANYTPSNWMNEGRRGKLCLLSTLFPYLIDAGIVIPPPNEFNWDALPLSPRMTYEEQVKYKYQIILDGVFTTYPGDRWRLLSNSVVFMHNSDIGHWFYDALIPWVHYVPVKKDLSDLMEKYAIMRNNDALARQLAYNAREFALNYLTSEAIAIYCYKVLLKYASLQKFNPSL